MLNCFGQRCGRIVVTVEDANAGLSKYEIKMKERKRDQEMQDKWAAHRRAEKKEEKRHEKMRATAVDTKNKAGAAVSPATEKKGPGRTTKVKISDGKEEEDVAVKDADDAQSERAARDRVHDAKVALGERGVKWWLVTPPEEGLRQRRDCARRALEREGLPEGWELEAAVDAVSPEDAGG
mgnify:CR=1 FL=1